MFVYLSSFTIVHMGKYEQNFKEYLCVHFIYGSLWYFLLYQHGIPVKFIKKIFIVLTIFLCAFYFIFPLWLRPL